MQNRPWGLIVACAGTALLGLVFVVFAGVSVASGHGIFSLQIGLLLAAFGLLLIGSAIGVWQLRMWARGPLAAFNLMAGFGFGEYLKDQVWMLALVLLCVASVVGIVAPSTTRALQSRVKPADQPRPPGAPRTWLGRFVRTQKTP
ncbi:hypothetical protein [Micropruina sp.]|uniref:hypothetical protein n=1 Tax=Micropruina sp. TaxID=2737536 RepID=UPI0039E48365